MVRVRAKTVSTLLGNTSEGGTVLGFEHKCALEKAVLDPTTTGLQPVYMCTNN
jgi:hypothetical protein